MSSYEPSEAKPIATARGFLKASFAVLLLIAFVVVGGILLVAALGQQGDQQTWVRWGNVGQTFEAVNSIISAVAVAGVLITWALQSRQMQVAQVALQRSVDAEVRNQHIALIQMAIDNPRLAEVWPNIGGKDATTQQQYRYANLLFQNVWLQYTNGSVTRDQMISSVRYLFASPLIRAFWAETANGRQSIYVEGASELALVAIANEIWAEYQSVLACSSTTDPPRGGHDWLTEDLQRPTPATEGP